MKNRRIVALLSGIATILLVICIVQAFTIAQLRESLFWAEAERENIEKDMNSSEKQIDAKDVVPAGNGASYVGDNEDALKISAGQWLVWCDKARELYYRTDYDTEAVVALELDNPEMAKHHLVQSIMRERLSYEVGGYSEEERGYIYESLGELEKLQDKFNKKGIADETPTCEELSASLKKLFASEDIYSAVAPYYLGVNFEKVASNWAYEKANIGRTAWTTDELTAAAQSGSL